MTPITRPLARESATALHSAGRARSVIVELSPPGVLIGFRLKGTRTTYHLPIDHCYREAVRNEVARRKRERAEQRKKARA